MLENVDVGRNIFLLPLLVASADERKPTTGRRRFPHPEEETQTAEAQEGKASCQTFIRSSRQPSPRWSPCPDDPTVAVATGGRLSVLIADTFTEQPSREVPPAVRRLCNRSSDDLVETSPKTQQRRRMASAASPASPRPIPAALKSVLESEVQKQEGREQQVKTLLCVDKLCLMGVKGQIITCLQGPGASSGHCLTGPAASWSCRSCRPAG